MRLGFTPRRGVKPLKNFFMQKYYDLKSFDLKERKYEILAFDLDGTLAQSKGPLDVEMVKILKELLKYKKVAILSGGNFEQFSKQILNRFSLFSGLSNFTFQHSKINLFKNLFLFPNSASSFFVYKNFAWQNIYNLLLAKREKNIIITAIRKALQIGEIKLTNKSYGKIIEDRGSEITFSALGMQAPINLKKAWDPTVSKRKIIKKILDKMLSQYSVKIGGSTSIDITKKGIDKTYGIKYLLKYLGFKRSQILYIGDALFAGGNDEVVLNLGIDAVIVKDVSETKTLLKSFLKKVERDVKVGVSATTEFTPWGQMRVFEKNKPVSSKILFIKKGEELSLQTHSKRNEFWRILKGHPRIIVGENRYTGKEGDEYFIEKGEVHQIFATNDNVEVLEITGGKFEDEDIVRLKDKYKR